MKRKAVLRCLSGLLAGMLLLGSPISVFAAENSGVTAEVTEGSQGSAGGQTGEGTEANTPADEKQPETEGGNGTAPGTDMPSDGTTPGTSVPADEQKPDPVVTPEVSDPSGLGKVSGLSIRMVKSTALELRWEPVQNAQKYEIYYSTSPDSGYKRAGSTGKTVYKFSKAKCGMTYYFKVRAQGKINKVKVFGAESDVIEGMTSLVGVPELYIAKSSYSGITIKWNKVKDAKKYEIYYATDPTGPWQLLKTQGSTKYTHKGMAIGTTCYYKVRAMRDYYITEFSELLTGRVDLGVVQGLKVASGNEQLQLSWKKVTGAQSYAIFRSDREDGDYEEVGSSKSTSYTDKGLKVSTVYYYKVYAMRGEYRMNEAEAVGQITQKETAAEAAASKPSSSSDKSDSSSSSNKKMYYGVDVSSYQGRIDWNAVADDGIDFAMVRILTGKGTSDLSIDTRFEYNYEYARKAGIKVGVYRYSYATTKSGAKREASRVVEVLNGRKLDYPVVLDMEESSVLNQTTREKRTEIIQAYKEVIEDAGYKFALYANRTWLENYIEPEAVKGVDIWFARWRSLSSGPGYNGAGDLTMWQYSNSGSVKGISGKVDLDVSYKKY